MVMADIACADDHAVSRDSLLVTRVWRDLRRETTAMAAREPLLEGFFERCVLRHAGLAPALTSLLGHKLDSQTVRANALEELIGEALDDDPDIVEAAAADLAAVAQRDPAAGGVAQPFLFFKGVQGLQVHRVAHWLWCQGRQAAASYLQSLVSERFAMDIHPAARLGRGLLIDHGTSLVIGETAVVGDNVSMLQEVTLGGTGKEAGDRHPKVREGVLLGAGAKVLGNIEIGRYAKVAAGSVVLSDVPPCTTVAGVPSRIVRHAPEGGCAPSESMDHTLSDCDC